MRTAAEGRSAGRAAGERAHRWVAAALVGVGSGGHDRRAERAARTGRYVVPATTRIDVLEVYCADCRAPYTERNAALGCAGDGVVVSGPGQRAVGAVR